MDDNSRAGTALSRPTRIVLLDGQNFWKLIGSYNEEVCFKKLLVYLSENSVVLEALWYTTLYRNSPIEGVLRAAEYAGWKRRVKYINKTLEDIKKIERKSKKPFRGWDIDPYVTADLVYFATTKHQRIGRQVEQITLISGNLIDYLIAIERAKSQGTYIQLLGSTRASNGTTSAEYLQNMRESGLIDEFIEYEHILPLIKR